MAVNRRKILKLASGAGFAGALDLTLAQPAVSKGALRGTSESPTSLQGPYVDLTTAKGNVTAFARLIGNLDVSRQKYGYYGGPVLAVLPNQAVQPLFGFHGFSVARLLPQEDGSWKKLLREVGYYTDLKTGEILEEWYNPFLDETVPVVPVANDPFNFHLTETFPKLDVGAETPDIPFILDWRAIDDDLSLNMDVHFYYPNMLDPIKWKRESSGKMVRVSEMFRYMLSLNDMQNMDLTTLQCRGSWNRINPWLPWMLMGPRKGHVLYACEINSRGEDPDFIPEKILRYTEENYPTFMNAPTEWYGPSLSSIENYARQQTPAPFKNSRATP